MSQDTLASNPFVVALVNKAAKLADRNVELLVALETRGKDLEDLKRKYDDEVKQLEVSATSVCLRVSHLDNPLPGG
jgi:hypothetical protein